MAIHKNKTKTSKYDHEMSQSHNTTTAENRIMINNHTLSNLVTPGPINMFISYLS